MITADNQIVIIGFLAERLDLSEEWFITKQDLLFGKSPSEVVSEGDGDLIIEWLADRLGLPTRGVAPVGDLIQ